MLLLGITSVCYAGEIKFFLVIGSVILAILTLQIVAETFVRAFNVRATDQPTNEPPSPCSCCCALL